MSGWRKVLLEEVTTKVGSGATPRGGKNAYKESGIPLIRSMNVHFDGFKDKGLAFIDEKQAEALKAVEVKSNDVLLNITGASIGRVTIAPKTMDGARVNQHVCIIRPNEKLYPGFLRWCLASPSKQDYIMDVQSGVTRQALTKGKILEFEIPLPEVGQQKRIVAKVEELFSHIDAGIEALKKAKQLLKQYRQSVLKAAVTGELTKDWREANKGKLKPASLLLERILKERRQKWEQQQLEQFKAKGKMPKDDKWKEKYIEPEAYENGGYKIPDSWIMARAEQVCEFITKGTTPKKDKLSAGKGDIPFIKVYNLTFDTSLDFNVDPTFTDKETHECFLARSKVYPGDVLMNIVGPPLGKVSIVSDIYNEWNINQAIAIYRAVTGLSNKLRIYSAHFATTSHIRHHPFS